jgi:hypothetical protein
MLMSFVERLRSTRVLKRGWKLLRAGQKEALAALAAAHEDPALGRPLQGMLAQCLAEDDDREGARAAFNRLHKSLKGIEDADARYLKIFALFHLALIRNSIPDAAALSRRARALKPDRRLRAFLPIPLLVAPPTPGPALTATV